jgi:2-polyprenyl-6-methoxyphenol hydroxylase-like FAD-dependent oxidoreductase
MKLPEKFPGKTVAIILGSGVAGLSAAQVASKYFDQVLVLDHDHLPESGDPRQFIPQANHAHLLHHHGGDILNRLFPGFYQGLLEMGSVPVRENEIAWFSHGFWKHSLSRLSRDFTHYSQSRTVIDRVILSLLRKNPKISVLERHKALSFIFDREDRKVIGVEVKDLSESVVHSIEAQIVIDASGNTSATPTWLKALGYMPPVETKVGMDLVYVSQKMLLPEENRSWKILAITPPAAKSRMGSLLVPLENNLWLMTQFQVFPGQLPKSNEEFLEFAKQQDEPHIYEAIKNGTPVSPVMRYRFQGATWRHYERLTEFPDGLIALGDAVCRLNPIYGQGMVSSAVTVDCLDRCLAREFKNGRTSLSGFPLRFFKAAAKNQKTAWALNIQEDFRHAQTTGARPFGLALTNAYLQKFLELSSQDARLFEIFLAVLNIEASVWTFFQPYALKEVLLRFLGLRKMHVIKPATETSEEHRFHPIPKAGNG